MKHIVMWKLKEEAEGEARVENAVKMKEMLEALVGVIPEIRSLQAGINENGGEWDVVLLSAFDSMEDLKAYDVHPAHEACKTFIRAVSCERAAIDFAE